MQELSHEKRSVTFWLVTLFIILIVISGVSLTAYYIKDQLKKEAITIVMEEGVKVKNVTLPMYNEETGELSCLIVAEELDYSFGKPAKMKKPIIKFYENGIIKTIIKGDRGEITFGGKFDPESLKVWGNMQIQQYVLEEEK